MTISADFKIIQIFIIKIIIRFALYNLNINNDYQFILN